MNIFIPSTVSHMCLYPSHLLVSPGKNLWVFLVTIYYFVFVRILKNVITRCVLLVWLLSLHRIILRFIHVFVYIISWFLLLLSSTPLDGHIMVCLLIYLLETWVVLIIWLPQIKKLWTSVHKSLYGHIPSFLWGVKWLILWKVSFKTFLMELYVTDKDLSINTNFYISMRKK